MKRVWIICACSIFAGIFAGMVVSNWMPHAQSRDGGRDAKSCVSTEFLCNVSHKMIAETALKIRDSKKYKGLQFTDENGNVRRSHTFEEFCAEVEGVGRVKTRLNAVFQLEIGNSNWKNLLPILLYICP